jgi:hypothetical protein
VVVCFRHSTKEQTCRMRICEAADFKNAGCNILFGTDMIPSWSNSVESETIGNGSFGLVNGQLEHLISMTDLGRSLL